MKEVLEDKFLYLSMESVFEAVSVELKPTVGIATDKATYQPGETMQITLDLENPTPTAQLLLVAWYLEISGEGNQTTIVEPFPVLLPAGADYSIPVGTPVDGRGTTDFTATWSVELLNPVTHEVVDSDTAEWNYEAGEVGSGETGETGEVEIEEIISETFGAGIEEKIKRELGEVEEVEVK